MGCCLNFSELSEVIGNGNMSGQVGGGADRERNERGNGNGGGCEHFRSGKTLAQESTWMIQLRLLAIWRWCLNWHLQ